MCCNSIESLSLSLYFSNPISFFFIVVPLFIFCIWEWFIQKFESFWKIFTFYVCLFYILNKFKVVHTNLFNFVFVAFFNGIVWAKRKAKFNLSFLFIFVELIVAMKSANINRLSLSNKTDKNRRHASSCSTSNTCKTIKRNKHYVMWLFNCLLRCLYIHIYIFAFRCCRFFVWKDCFFHSQFMLLFTIRKFPFHSKRWRKKWKEILEINYKNAI